MYNTTGEIIQKSFVRHGFMGHIDTVITLKEFHTKERVVLTVNDEEKAEPFKEGDIVEVTYDKQDRLQSITRLTSLADHYAESC
mgnify:FL=1